MVSVATNNTYLSLKGIYLIESQKIMKKWVGQSLSVLERYPPQLKELMYIVQYQEEDRKEHISLFGKTCSRPSPWCH